LNYTWIRIIPNTEIDSPEIIDVFLRMN